MQHNNGIYKNYFAWSCAPDGTRNAEGQAPDGEEYYTDALFFASHRWGDGSPPLDYSAQARKILSACVNKGRILPSGEQNAGDPMWDPETQLIKFVPESPFTDPSYHIQRFCALFSLWANEEDRAFWYQAAKASRLYLHKVCDKNTGLSPNMTNFDGSLLPPDESRGNNWGMLHHCYFSDAYRVAINLALDWPGSRPIRGKLTSLTRFSHSCSPMKPFWRMFCSPMAGSLHRNPSCIRPV